MEIIIDTREHKLIELFEKEKINIDIKQLELGDILITHEENILLIFERKTISDLISSIKDGRYHEQKSRLVSNFNKKQINYIIEGKIQNNKDNGMVYGAILNTTFRDNINIIKTFDLNETYEYIINLYNRIEKDIEKWKQYINNNNNNNEIEINPKVYKHSKKSQNISKEIVFINSLNNINGCSSNIAKVIFDKYQSMNNLINEYNKSDNPKLMLSELKVNSRKIGKVLSERIYEFLF